MEVHGGAWRCIVQISVTENLLCIAQMMVLLHLQMDTDIGTEAALYPGWCQARSLGI